MKMFQSAGIVCTAVFLGLFASECNARHGMTHDQWAREKSVMCYECNSGYDPRCGDPFDPYTIGSVNCSMKRPLSHIDYKPTFCRKTVQKVQGKIRVIRGCGYVPEKSKSEKECLLRTGTKDVQVRYCACKKDLCNTGSSSYPSRIALGAISLAITRLLHTA